MLLSEERTPKSKYSVEFDNIINRIFFRSSSLQTSFASFAATSSAKRSFYLFFFSSSFPVVENMWKRLLSKTMKFSLLQWNSIFVYSIVLLRRCLHIQATSYEFRFIVSIESVFSTILYFCAFHIFVQVKSLTMCSKLARSIIAAHTHTHMKFILKRNENLI